MTTAILAAITVSSLAYMVLSLAYQAATTRKRVGGLTFYRVGAYQISTCKPRASR